MRKRIGDFLLEKGLIQEAQIKEILEHSKRTGLKFGEAGIELGIVKRDALIDLFGPNFGIDFFHLEPRYFPPQTLDLIPVPFMIQHGVLPLGIKTESKFFRVKKMLNLGCLNPADKTAIEAVKKITLEKVSENTVSGVKIYLVLADQFLDVLQKVYRLSEIELRRIPPSDIHETLQLFLQNASDFETN